MPTLLKITKEGNKYLIKNKDNSIISDYSSFDELSGYMDLIYTRDKEYNFTLEDTIPEEEKESLEELIFKNTRKYCDKPKGDDETRVLG